MNYAYTIVDEATVNRWADASYENTGSWIHYWDQNGMLDENGEHTIYHAPISKVDFLSDFEALTASGDGIVAQTIEEAAAFIGCDVETLKAIIRKWLAGGCKEKPEEMMEILQTEYVGRMKQ